MKFTDCLASLQKWNTVHIESMNVDVEIKRMNVKEASKFDKIASKVNDGTSESETIIELVFFLGKSHIKFDDQPLFGDDDKSVVEDMDFIVCKELFTKFREVNMLNEKEVKDKVKN